ncbi:MAG: hypothetical protein A3H96_21665 [Acidobacteria bacterium RIFCSPLOWO2_02_FULL_67_36]|nr:MAG: hypothetical protein A3H96_21665 [Acidobacteria bacterium RIFCSPLOWO2_02_FULL_67_36]OFW20593.1 MAG: hypothetical protein A3G21_21960 [Acidobacteria bacterium RIFCSPLOWO2_12_FULL_66_21]
MPKKQMEPVNADVLARLTVEELEERLETQVLRVPDAACSWSCDRVCDSGYSCGNVGGCSMYCSPEGCQSFCIDAQVE